MNKSYSVLSNYYDKLISDCDYDKWSQYLLNKLNCFSHGKKGLDLACGSGKITLSLAKNGFNMSGADISEQMLSVAKNNADKQKVKITYFKTDLNHPISNEKYDFITVVNDGINYISHTSLANCFKGLKKMLKKGGILLFDISSEYKLRHVIGDNLFGEDRDDITYLWFNKLFDDKVEMDLTFFTKKGEYFLREDEKHVQYIHGTQDIINLLNDCGFKVLYVEGEMGEQLTNTSLRVNFGAIVK